MNTNDISVSSTRKMDPDVEDYIKGQREELRKMIPGFVNDEAYIDVILNFHEKGIRIGIEKGLQMAKEQILKDAMDAAKFSCGHVRKPSPRRRYKNDPVQFELKSMKGRALHAEYDWCVKNLPLKDEHGLVYQVSEIYITTRSQRVIDKVNRHFGSSFGFKLWQETRVFFLD